MTTTNHEWLLLIVSLPTNSATARMRIWRALKTLGCGSLRDGAYLLPQEASYRRQLHDLSEETIREGGNAWLLTVHAQSEQEGDAFQALFDRGGDYAELVKNLNEARKTLEEATPQEINRTLRRLRREYEAIRTIDYYPNDASAQAEAAWMDFVNVAQTLLSPDEPHSTDASVTRLDMREYQARTWATRRHLWVDRVASAWLIQRFIDRKARFLWLDAPAECPAGALGFDFDGAAFTHIGDRVTFEVLLASFGLEQDRGLARLGALVHVLDIGNGFVPEAIGFEAMLAGARQRAVDDNQLLAEIGVVLDSLYAHFSNNPDAANKQ
jgi:hypothetical protein